MELKFYEEHRGEFLALNRGQFALIKGEELIGTFSTLQEAYNQGIERFGNIPIQGLLRARL